MTEAEEQFLKKYQAASKEEKDRMYEELMKSVSTEQRRLYEGGAQLHIFQTAYRMRPKEWAETHPKNLTCASDKYYANLVNRLCEATVLYDIPSHLAIQATFDFACAAATYLEDLVSETHVWDSIRSLYCKTYGPWLPFYDCEHEDYLLDNVNIEDLKYLAWQTYNRWG